MIRLNYHQPGTEPGLLLPPPDRTREPASISIMQYGPDGFYETKLADFEELAEAFKPGKVNWVNIDGLGDPELLTRVGEFFKLHQLALEDVLNTTQRPKVEHYTTHYFVVGEMVYFEDAEKLVIEQVSMFFGDDLVLTIQERGGHDVFDRVRGRLRAGRGHLRMRGPDYLTYALLDGIVDQIFPILETVGDAIEELETELLENPSRSTLHRLYEIKRLLLQLRRAAWPQREIMSTLMRDDTDRVTDETKIYLRDCYDHTTQTIEILESYRDLTASLMDVYLSSLGFRTNEIMRVLTVVSTFFIPLTFLAGVYGMNFDTESPLNMPELKWPFGYIYFWCVCIGISAITFYVARKKRWL